MRETSESIDKVEADIADATWANGLFMTIEDMRAESRQLVGAYLERFPEQADRVQVLSAAIDSAGS